MEANFNTTVIYHGILAPENVVTAVNYCGIFKTLALVTCTVKISFYLKNLKGLITRKSNFTLSLKV